MIYTYIYIFIQTYTTYTQQGKPKLDKGCFHKGERPSLKTGSREANSFAVAEGIHTRKHMFATLWRGNLLGKGVITQTHKLPSENICSAGPVANPFQQQQWNISTSFNGKTLNVMKASKVLRINSHVNQYHESPSHKIHVW